MAPSSGNPYEITKMVTPNTLSKRRNTDTLVMFLDHNTKAEC